MSSPRSVRRSELIRTSLDGSRGRRRTKLEPAPWCSPKFAAASNWNGAKMPPKPWHSNAGSCVCGTSSATASFRWMNQSPKPGRSSACPIPYRLSMVCSLRQPKYADWPLLPQCGSPRSDRGFLARSIFRGRLSFALGR